MTKTEGPEYKKLMEFLGDKRFDEDWIFRAQPENEDLATTLERACNGWDFGLKAAHDIEYMMVREFRRVYKGQDQTEVREDLLYCLSLLRHHFAPARLLDFTYSKYVGVYFGLECAYRGKKKKNGGTNSEAVRGFTIWCINTKALEERLKCKYSNDPVFTENYNKRGNLRTRGDKSFRELYMKGKYKLAIPESPKYINERQHLQQGLFLCPGDIKVSFMENLLCAVGNGRSVKAIEKLTFKLKTCELKQVFLQFRRMNISRESLFPGLDGLASAMEYQTWFYNDLAPKIGEPKEW